MTPQIVHGDGLDAAALQALKGRFRGDLIGPDDSAYDQARRVQNGMIDKRPVLIARAVDAGDVIAAVAFGRDLGLAIAVRCGGHSGPGFGTIDDGLVIDLSRMRGVRVDPVERTARVDGGAQLGDVDHATHAFGLATPAGILSTTGVGGLTLGGGIGHLTRKLGLAIDNLIEADVVLASGELVRADEKTNSDLYWAIRGGGGNFGIVTSFLFRLHPVDTVIAGPVLYDLGQSEAVMRWWQDFIGQAPEELNGFFAFLTVPPAPPFPSELHMRKMAGVAWTYAGPADKADKVLAPVKAFGRPALVGLAPLPLPAWQAAFDALYPGGTQMYWRADFMNTFPDQAIALHAKHGALLPTLQSGMHVYPIDGAAARVGAGETAWSQRDVRFAQVVLGADADPANAGLIRDWTVTYSDALHPFSAGGAYLNFIMDEGQERVRSTYRDNYDRLARIKGHYDPENVFHVNQNIRPV
ncbi:MAG TPA: FAD-binding oxidoreductase [Candidatus Limnocylindrales bacterium]